MTRTIEELENFPIIGTFYHDRELWQACEEIVVNVNNPLDLRIRAIKVIDRIIGEERGSVTEADVTLFMEQLGRDPVTGELDV